MKIFKNKSKILGSWMCYQRMFKLSPVSCKKGQRIKTGKNNSWFSKLFEGDSQGKINIKYHGWLINFIFIYKQKLFSAVFRYAIWCEQPRIGHQRYFATDRTDARWRWAPIFATLNFNPHAPVALKSADLYWLISYLPNKRYKIMMK